MSISFLPAVRSLLSAEAGQAHFFLLLIGEGAMDSPPGEVGPAAAAIWRSHWPEVVLEACAVSQEKRGHNRLGLEGKIAQRKAARE